MADHSVFTIATNLGNASVQLQQQLAGRPLFASSDAAQQSMSTGRLDPYSTISVLEQ
jgi:hypothetical protein